MCWLSWRGGITDVGLPVTNSACLGLILSLLHTQLGREGEGGVSSTSGGDGGVPSHSCRDGGSGGISCCTKSNLHHY